MKTVLLHGLGQTAQDWKEVVQQLSISDVDCPELFSSAEDEISYSQILGDLEQRYSEVKEPLRICGLSLGALLAIDFAIRHEEKVASLVLIGAQYKVPSLLSGLLAKVQAAPNAAETKEKEDASIET